MGSLLVHSFSPSIVFNKTALPDAELVRDILFLAVIDFVIHAMSLWLLKLTLEFTCAELAQYASIEDYYTAQLRLVKNHD